MKDIFIHQTAEVSKDAKIGQGTKIWNHAQVREGSVIGENCVLSKCVYIGKDVNIGNNVKIQNRATIYQGVTIEDNIFIGPHVTFTNDLYPRSFNDDWKIVKTRVKEGASIGAASVILCGIEIGKFAMIGIGSVITKNVPDHGLIFGNPARLMGFVCRCGRRLKKIGENEENVIMECEHCEEKIEIPKETFNLLT